MKTLKIHAIPCKDCDIGKMGRSLKICLKEHISALKKRKSKFQNSPAFS